MKKKTNPLLKLVCNIDLFVAAIALAVLIIITSVGVVMRYALKTPILWSEEIQAFCQVWMVFLGGSVAFRMGSIVAIEMVVDAMPPKAKKIMGYVIDALVIVVLVYLATHTQAYIAQVFGKSGRSTPILRIPYTVVYGVAPYGCVLMLLSYLANRFVPQFCKDVDIDVHLEDPELIMPAGDEKKN